MSDDMSNENKDERIWFKIVNGAEREDRHHSGRVGDNQYVAVMKGDEQVGRIFSPAGTGEDCENAIQVCGFSEAFDLWGCAYPGFKDIQLLFDGKQYGNRGYGLGKCDRCFGDPCACEVRTNEVDTCPFIVKRKRHIKDRIKYAKK